MRSLPIGIQSFRELRKRGCIYVDKTRHILNLIHHGKYEVILFVVAFAGKETGYRIERILPNNYHESV